MFAYNPTPDRSAEIMLEGMQNFGQSIGQGLAGLGVGIGEMVKDARDKTAKLEGIAATGEALNAILPTYGKEGVALQTALQGELTKAGKNPDKLAGAMMAFMPAVENLQSRFNQQSQVNAWANYRANAPRMNAENIRSMVAEAKAAGFSDDDIKTKLQSQYGDWAVRSVYPPQNQGIWMGQ